MVRYVAMVSDMNLAGEPSGLIEEGLPGSRILTEDGSVALIKALRGCKMTERNT